MVKLSGAAYPAVSPQISLLVLQPTPFCNIDCSYCYLADRASTARMSLRTLDLACDRLLDSRFLGSHLEVAWHAGEPLAVPVAWYAEAVDLMAERFRGRVQLKHCFQTNGLLINEEWIRFFTRIEARVGVSVDGPADLHDANRRTRNGRGTHDRVMEAVRLLKDHGFPFHVITVLTERSLDAPDRIFDFYASAGIGDVGFNIEEIEGGHLISSLSTSSIETRFRKFLRRFLELVWASPGTVRLREFEEGIGLILSNEHPRDHQNAPFGIVSIDHGGGIATFSPELLGARHGRFQTFVLGHLSTHSLEDIAGSAAFRSIDAEIQSGVAACERTCPYFRWCGGGAPANKLFETGRFDATETMHCRLTRQTVLDEVINELEAHIQPRTTNVVGNRIGRGSGDDGY
ncbi:MAG: cyclophane-forming radical SAM/SPASM peptide maturase GrrM/OscB [Microvirga sp.]